MAHGRRARTARPTCAYSANPDLAAAANYTDLWWNPQKPGWGLNFSHQGNVILATWFAYDETGKATWRVALLLKNSARVYAGQVFRVAGPPFGGSYDPGTVGEIPVGTAVVRFTDGSSAVLSYELDDAWGSAPITRQLFAPPAGTLCQGPPATTATLELCAKPGNALFDPVDGELPADAVCAPRALPYTHITGIDGVFSDGAATVLIETLELTANDGPVTITHVSAFDTVGSVTPHFVGLTEGMVIAAGQTVTVELRTPRTGGRTADNRFSFRANGAPALDFRCITRTN